MHHKVWDETTYPFPNSAATFTEHVITYPLQLDNVSSRDPMQHIRLR